MTIFRSAADPHCVASADDWSDNQNHNGHIRLHADMDYLDTHAHTTSVAMTQTEALAYARHIIDLVAHQRKNGTHS